MNVVAIIQARMGSTRLTGKVLKDISGKPMLWHIINRLRFSKLINKIVVATSVNKKDDAIEALCRKNKIDFYRGSEEDVLDRYYQAAILYKADYVVRITADCPLIDPQVVDKVISGCLKKKNIFDGASNAVRRTFPRGLDTEVFPFSILKTLWTQVKESSQREHVTIFMYENPNLFKLYSVEQERNMSHLRWTVDEEKDLKLVKEIYNKLYKKKTVFSTEDIMRLLERNPYICDINKDVKQKVIFR
tara:strand:+ start:167 stop:904 length:738 start_codon:yes stop_codon:yes gene_type:complete